MPTSPTPEHRRDAAPCHSGACSRCERLPVNEAHTGDLYCWFPAAHVEGKASAVFRRFGIRARRTVADGLVFRFTEREREAVAAAMAEALSQLERDDTRALLCPEGSAPTPADLARVEPLSWLITRVGSGWLLEVLAEGRLCTHFQPIVHAADPDRVYGHEALLRGEAATGELIPPGRLFETARGAGLLFQLDLAARRSAIASAARQGLTGALFVNFAPTAIYDPASCLRSTVAAIDAAGMDREQVVFEIVETERAHDPSHLRRILDSYRGAGFRVALDDVGSGYSSLNLIHLLRPDILKLDMELVRNVHADPYKARIAANLLDVANALGIEALAEGIEHEEELAWVQAHGATYAQGYLIARPTPEPFGGVGVGAAQGRGALGVPASSASIG
jgi:EAL domain-containing protein (putative c-di-GMP-specific phosphodiesterase class I)